MWRLAASLLLLGAVTAVAQVTRIMPHGVHNFPDGISTDTTSSLAGVTVTDTLRVQELLRLNDAEETINGDDEAINVTENQNDAAPILMLDSNNADASLRTFTLTGGSDGQVILLMWDESGSDKAELLDAGSFILTADWRPTARYDSLLLVKRGTVWVEVTRVGGAGTTTTTTTTSTTTTTT